MKTFLLFMLSIPALAFGASQNIVELAASVKDLSTLVTAVKAASLVDTLSGAGPFTVFAPTNEAFAKIPNATLQHLLDPANIKELQAVLEYHVLSGSVHSKDLHKFQKAKTVEGEEVAIVEKRGAVFVNHAQVIKADVDASNGVVHVIDAVLIPKHLTIVPKSQPKNIVELAASVKDLSTLVTAVKAASLVDTLSGAGPFTVFAPTNEAFAKIPKATLQHLLDPANIKELQAVLEYHVLSGSVHSKDLHKFQKAKTVEGEEVTIVENSGAVFVNHAQVIKADVDASNGVVHIIDTVLIPPSATKPTKNIVEVAAGVKDLSTLVTALKAANLTGALSGKGPFTVFAPSNSAFDKIPSYFLNKLLEPKNVGELVKVLTYHVLPEAVHSTDLKEYQAVKTLEGAEVRVISKDNQVFVNNARVVEANVDCSNGVVHIVDHVLFPYRGLRASF